MDSTIGNAEGSERGRERERERGSVHTYIYIMNESAVDDTPFI